MPQMVHAGSFLTLLCDHVKLKAQSNMMKLKEIAWEQKKSDIRESHLSTPPPSQAAPYRLIRQVFPTATSPTTMTLAILKLVKDGR